MQFGLLNILTPFLLKSAKKWDSQPKKKKKTPHSDKGGLWEGHGNSILGHILCFTPYLIDFGFDMYVFKVKESIF